MSTGNRDREGVAMAENGQMVDGAARTTTGQFRLLFCGEKAFPSGFFLTKDYLKQSPHILVETMPLDEIEDHIHEYDMCVVKNYKLTSHILSRARKLKIITQFGMGLEGVDIEAATQLGIKVARIPSLGTGNALSCAEHAVYLMLSLLKNQKGLEQSVLAKRLGEPLTKTLFNTTVCIVGYGNIGKELAPRLKPFGVRVLALRRSWNKIPQEGEVDGTSTANGDADVAVDRKGGTEYLHDFISQADIVVMCCALTPETKGMVNEKFLASMKTGAFLVNVARGGLMDYDAVTEALNSGHLGGLGTDVTWVEPFDPHDPIIQHPNVVITPHVAGVTELSYRTMSAVIGDSALQLYEGKPVTGLEFVN
ncbi:unnamed protein product [Calypogeia fissa]